MPRVPSEPVLTVVQAGGGVPEDNVRTRDKGRIVNQLTLDGVS